MAFFEAIALRYDRDFAWPASESRPRVAKMLETLGTAPCEVLDLGIGTGRELPALLDAGHRVQGMDSSPTMIAECNRRARTVPIAIGDFYAGLPWPDATFDAVIALHGTLTHPPDREASARALFAEIARVLRPRGLVYFEVPHPRALLHLEREGEDGFVARDPRSGVRLRGVAWPSATWSALASAFALEERPAPSAYELVLAGRRR